MQLCDCMKTTLAPEVFFHCEEIRYEREKSGERKPLVAGDVNLIIFLLQICNFKISLVLYLAFFRLLSWFLSELTTQSYYHTENL